MSATTTKEAPAAQTLEQLAGISRAAQEETASLDARIAALIADRPDLTLAVKVGEAPPEALVNLADQVAGMDAARIQQLDLVDATSARSTEIRTAMAAEDQARKVTQLAKLDAERMAVRHQVEDAVTALAELLPKMRAADLAAHGLAHAVGDERRWRYAQELATFVRWKLDLWPHLGDRVPPHLRFTLTDPTYTPQTGD